MFVSILILTLCFCASWASYYFFSIGKLYLGVFCNWVKQTKEAVFQKECVQPLLRILRILLPVLWPKGNKYLLANIILCFMSVVAGCVLNMCVPILSNKIVDSLVPVSKASDFDIQPFRWDLILIFVALKLFQGDGSLSLMHCIQNIIWIPVEQFATRRIQVHFFEHLHRLSVKWHADAKTGEILGALERGTESATAIVEHIVYSIIPTIVDITIAIFYLSTKFNTLFGLIVVVQLVLYFVFTRYLTAKRSACQRDQNDAENAQKQKAIESMLNFETVKYFDAEKYESKKYKKTVVNFQRTQRTVLFHIYFLTFVQVVLINLGMLVICLLCAWMIVKDRSLTVGDYILLTTYLAQLYSPLNYLGNYYRILQNKLIGLEHMLDILETKPDITVGPIVEAIDLHLVQGQHPGLIEFRNVSFKYNSDQEILKNMTFTIPGGTRVALVGASGSGKTSIIRLLFRLYDPTSGDILIDGVNIKNIRQLVLSKAIAVVPQDTSIFADSLRNNIRYGKITATDSEIEDAAERAYIAGKISSLSEGYETMLGERGQQLSGGEKQRISISRILLRNPSIVLLDEATSALDSQTEAKVQETLRKLCQNRTSIIITHHLSSLTNAQIDEIFVLKNGEIIERGSPQDLRSRNGFFMQMYTEEGKKAKTCGVIQGQAI